MLARTRERVERGGIHDTDLHHACLCPMMGSTASTDGRSPASSSMSTPVTSSCDSARNCWPRRTPPGVLPNRRALYWRLQRRLKQTALFGHSPSRHQRHKYDVLTVREMGRAAGVELQTVTFFVLPLQRYKGRVVSGRRPRIGTLFLADLQRTT
jgi:hypothetical protein